MTHPDAALASASSAIVHGAVTPNDATTSDSTLSALNVSGSSVSALAPAFDPAVLFYEVLENDDASATVTPTPSQTGASVAVGGGPDLLSGGVATVPLTRGRNDITVTVTSPDSLATTIYHVPVWRLAAPRAQDRPPRQRPQHRRRRHGAHRNDPLWPVPGQLPVQRVHRTKPGLSVQQQHGSDHRPDC